MMKHYNEVHLTGEQAYNWGRHADLYVLSVFSYKISKVTFESYEQDGSIIARDEDDRALILHDCYTYIFYAPKPRTI